ncbi:SURF1 family protein [Sphingomonas zeicaulis]|uniref:SURF1 family protein n=1 Tax=Sphingomonas zeicaulis TaxID=1632740 RepID=UPI003D225A04
MALAATMLLLVAAFVALGVWQIQRRAWKHRLIAAVESRVHGAPVAAPGPAAWGRITANDDAYRRITATGRFRHDRETLVRATTVLGSGYWVMTPLDTTQGFTLIVNRGFVPPEKRDAATRTPGQVTGTVAVTGLLRVSEPGGGFLRDNDPAGDRWYGRDIAAIAAARGLTKAAPYFVDADAAPNPGGWPRGGLTVISFPDNHLPYALTWFGMALLSCWGAWWVLRDRGRSAKGEG